MKSLIWRGPSRLAAFWIVVIASLFVCNSAFPFLNLFGLAVTLGSVEAQFAHSNSRLALDALTQPNFALSLAAALGSLGLAILAAFGLMHWLLVSLSIGRVRLLISRPDGRKAFAEAYENSIYPKLAAHPLLGHAWKEFDETLLKGSRTADGIIGNTVRPHAFINYGVLRERLSGLKMLGSISGYFVGVGLLLTFFGIVLALYEAGEAAKAADIATMQLAMQKLLQIASFKFSTSIAGLGVSIVFAIVAKLLVISLEHSIAGVCDAAEQQMRYVAPQSLAVEMSEQSRQQLDQLKEIASDRYFSRLADSISPLIEAAMTRAMAPVTEQIGSAIGSLASTSQTGVGELIKQFSESVQGGAGTELRQLGATLQSMQDSLVSTKAAMDRSGENFTGSLTSAAENLNRLVNDAGSRLDEGAESNRIALQQMVETMRDTFDRANGRLNSELGSAAAGAAGKLETAMASVLERLDGQVSGLVAQMQSFQHSSADGIASARQQIADAQGAAASAIANTGGEAAKVLQAGLAEALTQIRTEFERFEVSMRSGAAAYAQQASAVGDAVTQTRTAATSFAQIAEAVRSSSAPLLQSSERIREATTELSASTRTSVEGITKLAAGAGELTEGLSRQVEQMGSNWQQHSERFEQADQSLATAVGELGRAMEDVSGRLNKQVSEVDLALSKVMDRLQLLLGEIGVHAGEISDSVAELSRLQQAAE